MRDFLYISIIFSIFVVLSYIIGAYVPDIEGIFFALKHKDTALPYYDHNGHNSPDEGLSKGRGGIPFLLPPQNLNTMLKNSSGDIIAPVLEIWKDIKGYEGLYQVSSLSRVRSIDRLMITKNNKVYSLKGQIIKPCMKASGYFSFDLCNDKGKKTKNLHRIVAENFIDNPLKKKQVNHINGNKKDNLISNLEWVTNKENSIHAFKNGLTIPPLNGGIKYKCTEDKKRMIQIARDLFKTGNYTKKEIADRLGVKSFTMRAIINRKVWINI